jgi:hypothetical protein
LQQAGSGYSDGLAAHAAIAPPTQSLTSRTCSRSCKACWSCASGRGTRGRSLWSVAQASTRCRERPGCVCQQQCVCGMLRPQRVTRVVSSWQHARDAPEVGQLLAWAGSVATPLWGGAGVEGLLAWPGSVDTPDCGGGGTRHSPLMQLSLLWQHRPCNRGGGWVGEGGGAEGGVCPQHRAGAALQGNSCDGPAEAARACGPGRCCAHACMGCARGARSPRGMDTPCPLAGRQAHTHSRTLERSHLHHVLPLHVSLAWKGWQGTVGRAERG